jgi:hypothetical protein
VRLIEAEWEASIMEERGQYLTGIKIFANNRQGLLMEISKIFTESKIDINSINTHISKQGVATFPAETLCQSQKTEEQEKMTDKTCGECQLNGVDCRCEANEKACEEFEQKITTNGDKIRQMSNDEFAKLRVYQCPPVPAEFCKGTDTVKCVKCWLNWLNAPAESEGGGRG